MKDARELEQVGKNWSAQIDGESWQELTRLFERVVNTLGVIAPVLDLAKNKNPTEKVRCLRAVVDLAFRGQTALKAFAQRWALVQEENLRRPAMGGVEDFTDIFQAAKQITIPNPASSSVDETNAAHTFCDVLGTDPIPNSGSVIAEDTHDLS